jgi:hypothetical protein
VETQYRIECLPIAVSPSYSGRGVKLTILFDLISKVKHERSHTSARHTFSWPVAELGTETILPLVLDMYVVKKLNIL